MSNPDIFAIAYSVISFIVLIPMIIESSKSQIPDAPLMAILAACFWPMIIVMFGYCFVKSWYFDNFVKCKNKHTWGSFKKNSYYDIVDSITCSKCGYFRMFKHNREYSDSSMRDSKEGFWEEKENYLINLDTEEKLEWEKV